MHFEHPPEKALSSLPIAADLQKHIDHLAILVNCSPQILLPTLDLHEDFIDEKCIPIALVPAPQSPGILGSRFVAPQTNSFIANDNPSLSQQIFDIPIAEIKPMIEPHGISNDFRGKAMTFVWAY